MSENTEEIKKPTPHESAIARQVEAIACAQANLKWLEENSSWLPELGNLTASFLSSSIFFHNPTHEQSIIVMRNIKAGKWSKGYNATSINYRSETSDGRNIYLCDSQPPGTCRLIPVVETVAAHWEPEKVINTYKLQCRDSEPEAKSSDSVEEGGNQVANPEPVVSAVDPVASGSIVGFIHPEEA